MSKRQKMTRNQKILLAGVIVAVVGLIVPFILHYLAKDKGSKQKVDVNVTGDKNVVIVDVTQGLDEKAIGRIVDTLMDKSNVPLEDLKSAYEEIGTLKEKLTKALQRVAGLERRGEPDAKGIIEELRKTGDLARLLDVLEKERDTHRDQLIERNHEIAAVAFLRGDIDVAQAATDEVLRLQPNDVIALNQKGHIYSLQGKLNEAEKAYLRVQELAVAANNEEGQAVASGNLGNIYYKKGELAQAEEMHNKALEIDKKLDRLEGIASAYGNLGLIYMDKGQLDKAEEMFNEVLKIEEKLGRQDSIANAYGNLGIIYGTKGELDKAEEMYNKALEIAEKLGLQKIMASAYGNLGVIYLTKGELDKAEEMYKKSLKISEPKGMMEITATQYGNLGLIYEKRGDNKKAREYWEKALAFFKKIGMKPEAEKTQKLIEGLKKD